MKKSDYYSLCYINKMNDELGTNFNDHLMKRLILTSSINKNDNILYYLSKIYFKQLIILELDNNNIKVDDLGPGVDNFYYLNQLYTPLLNYFYLNDNMIIDLGFLDNPRFMNLIKLDLSNNLILSIFLFKYFNLPNLINLDLSYNLIDNIDVLYIVNFKKIEILNFDGNYISYFLY